MKLMLPEVLDALDRKTVVFMPVDAVPDILGPKDKVRQRLLAPLTPLLNKAQKYIFDSGSDQDERTVTAVRETAVNMLEAGLFHLPYPIIWIEDPYEGKEDTQRNFYLCIETPDKIVVHFFQKMDMRDAVPPEMRAMLGPKSQLPALTIYPQPMVIDLKNPTDLFQVMGARSILMPDMEKVIGECIYGVKKFLVALNTDDLITERVRVPPGHKQSVDKRHRLYEHTIIRIPMDDGGEGGDLGTGGAGRKRRCHLVRGYTWGKNTRPVEEQRWIKPFWRGDRSVGTIERSHYVVGGKRGG